MDTIPFHWDTLDAPQCLRMTCLCPDECHEDLVCRLYQRRHRRRNKRPPAAKGQALRGARLKALLALDFCLFMRGSSCKPDSQYATTDSCRSKQGFLPDPISGARTILWTGVGQEKRKRMAGKRSSLSVRGSRVELPRLLRHYLLRVARLPISPPAHQNGLQIYEMFSNSQKGGAISSGA